MAITQVGSSMTGSTSTTTSLSINRPAGVAADDILIAAVTSNNSAQTAPAGWTNFDGLNGDPDVLWQVQLYWKKATGSEPSSYAWTVGSAGPSAGLIQAWRGVDTTTPIDGTIDTLVNTGDLAEPINGPSVTVTSSSGKLFYIRGIRRNPAASTVGTMSTADANASWHITASGISGTGATVYAVGIFSANAQYVTSGVKSGLAISYSHAETSNYRATFGLKEAGLPATGSFDSQLQALSGTFAGERVPNTGTMAGELLKPTATMAGQHLIPAVGTFSGSLQTIQSSMAGNTPVLAQLSGSLSLSMTASGETRQFGEHIIVVERDHRAFLVVDDETATGLKPIKRSRVTQE